MKTQHVKTLTLIATILVIFSANPVSAQSCTPQGDQVTYGTSNIWRGYIYRGINFDVYRGYVTEGAASSPNFDENFGGDNVQYATQGCSVYTDTFSVRYKLTKTFSAGVYEITVGGDDGYRLSVDGGVNWVINEWNDHSYQTTTVNVALNGTHNLVLEYYERYINNRVSFSINTPCAQNEDPSVYGSGAWIGYVYSGMNFGTYKGSFSEGTVSDPNFDENFGGDNTSFNTSGCPVTTNQFSVRYRMQRTLPAGVYMITVGADDGYRLSLNGGATWVIDNWTDHGYTVSSYTATLSGSYNMVLEYYENGGGNRVTFSMSSSILPVKLMSFSGNLSQGNQATLNWKCAEATGFSHFIVQKGKDGRQFSDLGIIDAKEDFQTVRSFSFTDKTALSGTAYYRLAMVDKDGTIVYSSVVMLAAKSGAASKIYPTLVHNGNMFVETGAGAEQAKLEIFDMNGRTIYSKRLSSGKQQISIPNGVSPAGSYVARISDGNEVMLNQMIVLQ